MGVSGDLVIADHVLRRALAELALQLGVIVPGGDGAHDEVVGPVQYQNLAPPLCECGEVKVGRLQFRKLMQPLGVVAGIVDVERHRVEGGILRDQVADRAIGSHGEHGRSEEHTYELQSLMRISYALFCLKKKTD